MDGALSRLSLASPAVTEAMILATGAAVAGNIPELVRKTKYVYELIGIEEIEDALRTRLDPLTQGCGPSAAAANRSTSNYPRC